MKNKSRSSFYQYKILETSFDPHDFTNIIPINTDFSLSDNKKDLRDLLCEKTCEIALNCLKHDEYIILISKFDGSLTQMEIANLINSNQSSVSKRIHTIIAKVKKRCMVNKEILELLERINEEED